MDELEEEGNISEEIGVEKGAHWIRWNTFTSLYIDWRKHPSSPITLFERKLHQEVKYYFKR